MNERHDKRGQATPGRESSPPLERLLAEFASEQGITEIHGPEDGGDLARDTVQYIRFMMDGVHFAVPLQNSLEVGHLPAITPLPNLPSWVSGISHIRGDVVSMVDLKQFFGRSPSSGVSGRSMVLLHSGGMKVGVRVDRLMGLVSLDETNPGGLSNPFTQGDITPYLAGVAPMDEALLYLLDVGKLLASEKMNSFQRI